MTYGAISGLNGVEETQKTQIERCEAGNEIRIGLTEEKEEELEEIKSHGVPYYEQFLSGTEAQIRELRQDSIKKVEKRLERYAPDDCKDIN